MSTNLTKQWFSWQSTAKGAIYNINAVDHKKRLTFAKTYIYKDNSFWNRVIFSDESKFNIFGSDCQNYVWRKPNTELEIRHLHQTVKHGSGSVMVWGCMTPSGTGNLIFIDGILDKYRYLNIFKNSLKESACKLGLFEDFHFQHDNDPKHTARIVKELIVCNTPHILITLPRSPDINPIENLWAEIGKRWNTFQITSKQVFKNKIIEIWNSVECSFTKSLVYSMERRLRKYYCC